jgi:transcriptional regulator with XRE-family HTH domain
MNACSPLRLMRFERGCTQDEIATAVGCRQWIISMLERGERLDGPTLPKVARYFGIPPKRLRAQMQAWKATAPAQTSRLSMRKTG